MDQQHGLVRRVIQIAHDLLDHDVEQALFAAHVRRGVPGRG
jgi:hypothetical protein